MFSRQEPDLKVGSDEWIVQMWNHQKTINGYESRCLMGIFEEDLEGKRVLDIGCRDGKGCYKLGDAVGEHGLVVGIDWIPRHIKAARKGIGKNQAAENPGRPM